MGDGREIGSTGRMLEAVDLNIQWYSNTIKMFISRHILQQH
jgi:hypothetical protein